jgi:parallel beta-helix repeat protein
LTILNGSSVGDAGGIYLENGSEAAIAGCIIGNSIGDGIGSTASSPTIDQCVVYGGIGSTSKGIAIGAASTAFITGCTIVGNGAEGIRITNSSYLTAERNIIAWNDNLGVSCIGGSSASFECCDLYGNTGGDGICGTDLGGNFSEDPLFCDAANADFGLDSNSPCLEGNHPSGALCGRIGAVGQSCGMLVASLDIKPGACPNPFNMRPFQEAPKNSKNKKGGVLPVALLGSAEFDAGSVDVSTLRLEGAAPLHHGVEDVSSPAEMTGECECAYGEPDGYPDLTLKFSKQEIAETVEGATNGDLVPLALTGTLYDGTPFEAVDCVLILNEREPLPAESPLAGRVILGPAAPNPFNPSTKIHYQLPAEAHVQLRIFDVAGRVVATLVSGMKTAGDHFVQWDAEYLPSGVYFCRIEAAGVTHTRKLLLVK